MKNYKFSFPTLIHFGPKVRNQVPDYLKSMNLKRPMIVTDKSIAALKIHEDLLNSLNTSNLNASSFSGVYGNPVKSQVLEGVKAFKQFDADCIIGLGGGAALDVAKAVALMIHHSGDLFDYEDEKIGARPIDQEIPFWIALPTTAGTGSEVGRSAVISDDKTHLKKIIFSPRLLAKAVFADPELTLELPPKITASTGMDALTHCIEAFLAKDFHPICDGIALEGFKLGAENIRTAVTDPTNIEARSNMLLSSMMGAIAFQKGLGIVHSCAHALGTVVDMHHGLANGIMIEHALKHNEDVSKLRMERLAQSIGLKTSSEFLKWLTSIKKEIGIPLGLKEAKVDANQIENLVKVAIEDSCHQNNPKPCTKEDFLKVFKEAFYV